MPAIRNPFEALSFLPRKKLGYQDAPMSISMSMRNVTPPQQEAEEPGFRRRDWSGYLDDLKEIYSKTGSAETAYQQHLQNLPEQQKPSVWGRIVAGIVGGGVGYTEGPSKGIAAGQGIIRRPYERQLEEWQNKEAGLGRSAELEEKNLGRKLGYMKEVREVAKDQDEYDKIMADYLIKRDTLSENKRLNDARIKDYARRGMIRITDPETGRDVLKDPTTGEVVDLGKSFDWVKFQQAKDVAADASKRGWAGVETGRANAQTARGNLGVAQKRLELEGKAATRADAYLELAKETGTRAQEAADLTRQRAEVGEPVSNDEQQKIKKTAIARAIITNRDWSKFADEDKDGNFILDPSRVRVDWGFDRAPTPEDLVELEKFKAAIAAEEAKILGVRRPKPLSGLSGAPTPKGNSRYVIGQ
jgi:hypothetical protein